MPKDSVKLNKVTLNLPFGMGGTEWQADPKQREAAWSLYVELVTRIAVQPLESDQGLLREALTSLYNLFPTTREILKAAGPGVGASHRTVGGVAIRVLNVGLRPFLAKWHPLLQVWEAQRPEKVSPKEHEKKWSEEPNLRSELEELRENLQEYRIALAIMAGVEE